MKNVKSRILSAIGITVIWSISDFIFHGKLLHTDYMNTATLWRPMAEMSHSHMTLLTFLTALLFTLFYGCIISDKSQEKGIKLGIFTGILIGVCASGSYLWMPITLKTAIVWFLSKLINYTLAGAIVGALITTDCCKKE